MSISPGQWGWLKDKFWISWQIVPTDVGKMMQDKDPEKANLVMESILQMDKIDINRLQQAYAQP
ncbi:MAG: hypothetical protein H0W49_15080 [Nitrospirales bacterium]|nr:hypothetical protein [Nitrospirales bacterium]